LPILVANFFAFEDYCVPNISLTHSVEEEHFVVFVVINCNNPKIVREKTRKGKDGGAVVVGG